MEGVQIRSKAAEEMHEKCDLPRALMGGTAEMREEGREFLPQHPAESDAAYEVRLNGTTLYNGFADTVKKQTGKVFSKPVSLNADVPPQLVELSKNIDGSGRDITAFFFDVFKEALVDGVSYVIVDMPVVVPTEGAQIATMADQANQGARPYTIAFTVDDLIGWRSESIGGNQVLTELRIKEEVCEQTGDFSETWHEQIRVFKRGSFSVYRKVVDAAGKENWILIEEGVTSLSYIPCVPVYVNRIGFFEGEPPLMPLAELNQEHWISSSEQRKALSFARFAMLAIAGVDPKSVVEVGPDKVLKLPAGATANYVEPSGAAIAAGAADIEAIEKRMQHAGMSVRVQTTSGVTATAASIDSAEADAALVAAATALEDSIAQVLQMMADYLNIPDGGTVSIDKTFGKAVVSGTPTEILAMYLQGAIPHQTMVEEMHRRGVLQDASAIEIMSAGMSGSEI